LTVKAARRLFIEGVVQGVGFRPHVHGVARRYGLAGWVRNTTSGVEVEVEGDIDAIERFVADLTDRTPPLAQIEKITKQSVEPSGRCGFTIEPSSNGDGFQPVAADVATCDACLADIRDHDNRRFGYPFTNCTDCGPRFTIIRSLPYDRANTTMADFQMCPRCQAEYDDPADRRFHAQPNACPLCGPRLTLTDGRGAELREDPIAGAARRLMAGEIVAIKGIGGFHLACDALNESAVMRLRERKWREAKPLAVMVPDLRAAQSLCEVSTVERALLTSPARPIVLTRLRVGAAIARSVAPGLRSLGVMLPYSPLHHLLFAAGCPRTLLMTSGNRSDEPIAIDNGDAISRLGEIADAFVLHDRPIHVRCDDSVSRVVDDTELPMRRSRGYAPLPIELPFRSRAILGCGGQMKNTICLTRGDRAFLSPHIGDLDNYDTFASYEQMAARMKSLFRVRPEAVAHDLHPDYGSTRYALSLSPELPRIAVQHHHAHVAACMAENGMREPVIGVAFDGTGYGGDGTVWGGEFIVARYADFIRAAHLGCVPMPGGELAIREPLRMALAHLTGAFVEWDPALPPLKEATSQERRAIESQIKRGFNAPLTSSVGRLFDAVASLVGVCHRARYEGQAAMELEAAAGSVADRCYPIELAGADPIVIDPAPIIRAIVEDIRAGASSGVIASRFHATLAKIIVTVCLRLRERTELQTVALSGGVFQNAILLTAARRGLMAEGFTVFIHRRVPPNDGGLALGQAVVANARLETFTNGRQQKL
jgi:hydrogenase maturation protein HypF